GSAYVRGIESTGVIATLKHFAGYSTSRAGRNLAPVSIGPRELADVLLPPFEMALRAGARSVMNSYTDNDGVPVAADPTLLTERLRGRVPAASPWRRRVARRCRRAGAGGGDRCRAPPRRLLRRAAGGGGGGRR